MTNGTISISPSSTFLTYVAVFQFHLHIMFTVDSVCKRLFDIRSVFNSRQSADKQVDATGVSMVSFTDSSQQILRSLQRSSLPIQPFVGLHAVWYASYQSLSRSWHTDLDYDSYRLPNLEIRLTAGVTSRQRMLTPPRHLIPLLVYL
jgi:hypothetical protein